MILRLLLYPFGTDFFCLGKKFLVFNLVNRNLKAKYHRSFLGWLWTMASPLAMAIVYYFTFKVVLKVQQPHFLTLLLGGVLPWSFCAQTLNEGTDAIVGSVGLLSKVPIPLPTFPLVGAITNFITLLLAMPILFGVAIMNNSPLSGSVLLLPLYYGLLLLFIYSVSYAFAVFNVFFRDLKHLLSILIQIWFYATPVIYSSQMVPDKYKWILYVNPLGATFAEIQNILIHGAWPSWQNFLISVSWSLGSVFTVAYLHKYHFTEVVENI
jgi:ABC-type polysaccharide/polyol phosphate export permease